MSAKGDFEVDRGVVCAAPTFSTGGILRGCEGAERDQSSVEELAGDALALTSAATLVHRV